MGSLLQIALKSREKIKTEINDIYESLALDLVFTINDQIQRQQSTTFYMYAVPYTLSRAPHYVQKDCAKFIVKRIREEGLVAYSAEKHTYVCVDWSALVTPSEDVPPQVLPPIDEIKISPQMDRLSLLRFLITHSTEH